MASIRPVPYDTIMAVQIFPFLAGRVETHHPARIVVPQRRRQVPRSVGRESFFPADSYRTRTTTRAFRQDGKPIAALLRK